MNAEEAFRKEIDSLNKHDAAAFATNYAPTATVHDPAYPEPLRGTDAIKKDVADFFAAFPDLKANLHGSVVSGDKYAVEWSVSGTHKGPFAGPSGPIPATNRKVEVRGAAIGRFDDQGRIAEERRYYDLAGMMSQLGLME